MARMRLEVATICTVLLVGCGADRRDEFEVVQQALSAADGAAPSTDTDFVLTPAGKVHKSCLVEVPNGATIDPDMSVRVAGKVVSKLSQCQFPTRASPNGAAPVSVPPGAVGWVEASTINQVGTVNGFNWFNRLYTEWSVPALPPSGLVGQVIYLFNDLQANGVIIQPVLQYGPMSCLQNNCTCILNPGGWQISSYMVGPGNNTICTSPINVNPGDTIAGQMQAIAGTCNASGVCNWLVQTLDGESFTGFTSVSPGTAFSGTGAANPAVLEAYNNGGATGLTSCSQFPGGSNGYSIFNNTTITMPGPGGAGYQDVTSTNSVQWVTAPYPILHPGITFLTQPNGCGYGVNNFQWGTTLNF